MENQTTTTEQPKAVKLYSRCEAATWIPDTRQVHINNKVDPQYLIQDLIVEIQVLTQKVQELEKENKEWKEKLEPKPESTVTEGDKL